MKSRTQFSASGKLRVSAYVGACAAWAASGHEAVADPIHEYFDPSKNSVQVTDELVPSDWNLGIAGNFNFILDPPLQAGENPKSGFIWAAQLDINGFVPSELKFSTLGDTTQLQAGLRTDYYYGAALRRYIEGDQIDGAAILGAGGATDYTAGYLFQFDNPTGDPNGNFNNNGTNFEGFVGFAFRENPTGPIYSGWIFIESIAADYSSYNILDWYYSTGTVYAGDGRDPLQPQETVPEPSSLGLLAVGAAGIVRYRRRRRSGEVAVESQPAA
jgi:hypothetical protein